MQKYSKFLEEIYSSPFIVEGNALEKYIPYLQAIKRGAILALPELPVFKMGYYDEDQNLSDKLNPQKANNVAVIPIDGVMSRSNSWYNYGMDFIAKLAAEAYADNSIQALVFKTNTPGGSTESIFPIKELTSKKNKPTICAVDSNALSCGYYLAALCDKVIAVDGMAKVGSIGVQASFMNWDGYYEEMKIKEITITPPESSWKNKAYKDAKKGDESLMIQEELGPWARHFQSVVRANRKGLNNEVEGLLEGRTFFANYSDDQLKVNGMMAGLIDDVMPFDDIITLAFNMAKANKINNLFNN